MFRFTKVKLARLMKFESGTSPRIQIVSDQPLASQGQVDAHEDPTATPKSDVAPTVPLSYWMGPDGLRPRYVPQVAKERAHILRAEELHIVSSRNLHLGLQSFERLFRTLVRRLHHHLVTPIVKAKIKVYSLPEAEAGEFAHPPIQLPSRREIEEVAGNRERV